MLCILLCAGRIKRVVTVHSFKISYRKPDKIMHCSGRKYGLKSVIEFDVQVTVHRDKFL